MMRNISLGLHSQSLVDQNRKDNIRQTLSSPHYLFAQIFTKSLMLITIPFSLLSNNRSNPRPLNDDIKIVLARGEIWNEMQRFTWVLLTYLDVSYDATDSPILCWQLWTTSTSGKIWKSLKPTMRVYGNFSYRQTTVSWIRSSSFCSFQRRSSAVFNSVR